MLPTCATVQTRGRGKSRARREGGEGQKSRIGKRGKGNGWNIWKNDFFFQKLDKSQFREMHQSYKIKNSDKVNPFFQM
jgi:hypothetical protein